MGKKPTLPGGRAFWATWLCAVAAGCASGDDPDPRAIAAALQANRGAEPALDGPQLVTASVAVAAAEGPTGLAAPAPVGETMGRQAQLEAPTLEAAIVVGFQAQHVLDRTATADFLATLVGVTAKPASTTDREAVEHLMLGRADFGVIGGALSMREQQAGVRQTRIGAELFAVSVPPTSGLRSLTHHQVRQIFSGQVTDWSQLGLDGGPITALVPSDRQLAERAAKALIPGDGFAANCVKVASEKHLVAELMQKPGAIGVLRVTDQPREGGQKLLMIDWCQPTIEAFGYGTYPFGIPVHVITSGQPSGIGQQFLDFARSERGRATLGRTLSLLP